MIMLFSAGAPCCGGDRSRTPVADAGADGGAADAGAGNGDGAGQSTSADSGREAAVVDLVDPWGLALDKQGNLLVAEGTGPDWPGAVLKIALASDTASLVATETSWNLQSMTADDDGNLYLTTGHGETILRVRTASAAITTLAGSGHGYADGVGAAAQFSVPDGIAIDGKGNLFVAEFENHTIRKIAIATGTVTTVAGAALEPGNANGAGGVARFKDPTNLAYDRSTDTLYVADAGNGLVRRIDIATNMVTTLAGDGRTGTLTDGTGTSAAFDAIGPMIADGNGNLYVGDRATIRKITLATAVVTTIAGTRGASVSRDGIGASAFITFANGLALDGAGGLYFSSCQTIRKLDLTTGAIVTLFGFPDSAHASLLGCVTHGRLLHQP